MKKFLLGCLAAVLLGGVLGANDYLNVLDQAENWINNTYKAGSLANRRAKNDLAKIDEEQVSETEKITRIKKAFPKAFQKEEKPLIFKQPVLWHIHSLSLGYDIQESATQTLKAVDISKAIASRKSSQTTTRQDDITSTHKVDTQISAGNEFSLNPFSWLAKLFTTKVKLAGSYAYGRNSVKRTQELWSKSQQEMFSQESEYISQMIHQTNIKNFHLTFTVTIYNNGDEKLFCDLSEAYIPVYGGERAYNINATPYGIKAKILEIPPQRNMDITFRMELDNTNGRALAVYMQNNAPVIDILKGGNLRIQTQSGKDAIGESIKNVATAPIKINLPGFVGDWKIRRNHTSNGKFTTLQEALNAIVKDFEIAIAFYNYNTNKQDQLIQTPDLFKYSENGLTSISNIPLGKFAENDKDLRYIAFLQIGDKVYDKVSAELLNANLPADGTVIWVIDLDDLEKYKNIHPDMQKLIYEKISQVASDGFLGFEKGNPAAQWRLGEMYSCGFWKKQNFEECEKWFRKAAIQNYYKTIQICTKHFQIIGIVMIEYYIGYKLPENLTDILQKYYNNNKKYSTCFLNKKNSYVYIGKDLVPGRDYLGIPIVFEMPGTHNDNMINVLYLGGDVKTLQVPEQYKSISDIVQFLFEGNSFSSCSSYDIIKRNIKNYELKKSAINGDANAQNELGNYYYNLKNYNLAFNWYSKSAEQNHKIAKFNLAGCYYRGEGTEKDVKKAFDLYLNVANEHNLADAQYAVGLCFYLGVGVDKNLEEAKEYFQKAAKQGHKEAIKYLQNKTESKPTPTIDLIDIYKNGVHFLSSGKYTEAIQCFRKSAYRNYPPAQNALGHCYEYGLGVPVSKETAFRWYWAAATENDSEAQFNLGRFYELGYYINIDIPSAKYWYRKAAKQGDKHAKDALQRLEKIQIKLNRTQQLNTIKTVKKEVNHRWTHD